MDAYAKQGYDRPFGDVTRDRRVLWSAANVLRRLCYYATGSVPDYLRSFEAEPKRRSERCGRPTLKGTRCKNPVKFGRVACHSHATPEETLAAREWQDSVHLPFARSPLHLGGQVRVASLGLIDVLKELA